MAGNSRYQFQAVGLAALIEFGLLAGAAIALASTSSTKPVLSGSETISLVNEDPQTPVPKPKPQLQPQPKAQPKPQVAPEEPKPELPQVAEAQANAFTEPTPPPPVAVAGNAEPSAEYAAKVRAAVQAAQFLPPAAYSLHYTGRVKVEFHMRDKVPSAVRVLVGSGMGMIDRVALQSVQNAKYPEPPPEIQGSDHVYQVWVEFRRE
ncbi:energy transducer TonB [Sideroxydans sp. CL21]|uniref:energy transducer TonB n=1 Tax=Sideroxydans sp. CL21 TaxID=2600596 RepID=UPI0024BC64C0|nr:energy transducer TonB [Sideroxydans sp. CL21]